jgi:hypothetical protein
MHSPLCFNVLAVVLRLRLMHQVVVLRMWNDMMVAGIAFQVATMAICGLLAVDFAVRVSKVTDRKVRSVSRPAIFCATSAFAYTVILIRSIYR